MIERKVEPANAAVEPRATALRRCESGAQRARTRTGC